MLKKLVDGIELNCTEQEESLIKKKWLLNETFPEYFGHLSFDGVSEPFHVIENCKTAHKTFVDNLITAKLEKLNWLIESAEENSDEAKRIALIRERKRVKECLNYDDSKWNKIEDLKNHLEMVKII